MTQVTEFTSGFAGPHQILPLITTNDISRDDAPQGWVMG